MGFFFAPSEMISDVLLQDQRRSSTKVAAGGDASQPAEGSSQPEPASGSSQAPASAAAPALSNGGDTSLSREGGQSPGGGAEPAGWADLGSLRLQLEAALAEGLALRAQRDEALQQVRQVSGFMIVPFDVHTVLGDEGPILKPKVSETL